MNIFFDEDSQRLIVGAKKEMFNLKHPYVGTEHLLLAILKDEELSVTKILNSYNITYRNFYDELIKSVGEGTKSNEWFLFTPMLKKIINNAGYYSTNNKITPYSLVVSIFQEGDGVANRILLCLKIDIDSLYEKFLNSNEDIPITDKKILLDELGINMNKKSLINSGEKIIGRDKEIDNIIQVLLRKNKNNPLLLGEAGVGKTAIVEELARRIVIGNVPLKIKDFIIYNLPMSTLVSGTKYRGEFEERFEKIIKEAINNPNIVLFIDEIHTIIGAGGAEGAIDASNIIKPYLARDNLKIIGATTTYEYYKSIEKDKAFNRRFHKILIEEPTSKEVKKILNSIKPIYEEFHNVKINDKLTNEIIKSSKSLLFYGKEPDKSIDLLDEVCSFANFNSDYQLELEKINNKLKQITISKNEEIGKHNFTKALKLRKKELKLESDFNNNSFINSKIPKEIEIKDLYEVLYRKTRIPINNNYLNLNPNKYNKEVKVILQEIEKYNFLESNKPLTFFLTGEDTKCKEKTINFIINKIFDDSIFVKLDMNEYRYPEDISKLIGSKYHNDKVLLNKVKDHPFLIILIENINKCHYSIYNYLNKSIERGYFTDYENNKYYISKSIIFFTIKSIELVGFNKSNNIDNKYLDVNKVIDFNNKLIKS